MKHPFVFFSLIIVATSGDAVADPLNDPLCVPLRAFVASVKPNEKREFTFHTSWGGGFKDDPDAKAVYAKRCIHSGYAPAQAVCSALMEHGAIEFSGTNVTRTLSCLSRKTRFGPGVDLTSGVFSLNYGTPNRGSNVSVEFNEDPTLGGMALHVVAEGY